MRTIRVDLPNNGYDIHIGEDASEPLRAFLRERRFSRVLVVTDSNVKPLYAGRIVSIMNDRGLHCELGAVEAGEPAKSLAVAETLYTAAIKARLDRKSLIVALGGGVVGDLAGFVAATYMRGVPLIQVPTTLLAQVDSSVGGKVAVNHELGKNLIGAFYQPQAVFIGLNTLATLPPREISTGLGEIIKYGAIADIELFAYLEEHADDVLALSPTSVMEHVIARSCEIKADVVRQDERESGLRRILNFGHTLAHAIEEETRYVRYNHGEAVAIGMVGAAHLSRALGLLPADEAERLIALIKRLRLPVSAEGVEAGRIAAAVTRDKKTVNGIVNWVLLDRLGHVAEHTRVPGKVLRSCLPLIMA